MFDPENFKAELFLTTNENFEEKALQVFKYQWKHNKIYRSYCDHLYIDPQQVDNVVKIPFLPIEFFKTHRITSGEVQEKKVFMSSGTTGQTRSKHFVNDLSFYHKSARYSFEATYGKLDEWEILALLPSYLEQGDSSLVSMVDHFIRNSQSTSRFVLGDFKAFAESIQEKSNHKRMVIGVSYALLDYGEKIGRSPCNVTVLMETGGMKGRRKEMTRNELHYLLKNYYRQEIVHSEYGMTELLSQAYGSDGRFSTPPWCRILIRDVNDPFTYLTTGKTGGMNIIDLANIDSCAFIETKDLGKLHPDAHIEILGRFDNSEIRGCNLLV